MWVLKRVELHDEDTTVDNMKNARVMLDWLHEVAKLNDGYRYFTALCIAPVTPIVLILHFGMLLQGGRVRRVDAAMCGRPASSIS